MKTVLVLLLVFVACMAACLTELSLRQYRPSSDERIFNLLLPSKKQEPLPVVENGMQVLICTMLTDDFENYALGALSIIRTLREDGILDKVPGVRTAILEIMERPIPSAVWRILHAEGWQKKLTVSRIQPRNSGKEAYARFKDQFSKLHLWNYSEYSWIFHMDSDIFILRSMRPLLNLVLAPAAEHHNFYAVEDLPFYPGAFIMGLFALKPNRTEFQRFLHILHHTQTPFAEEWMEQGFLNMLYEGQWGKLPNTFATHLGLWQHPSSNKTAQAWDAAFAREIQAIHFTMVKPWTWWCPWSPWAPVCSLFWNKQSLKFHALS